MSSRPWLPLFSFLLLACAGCELGPKLACNVDGDCFDGLTCVEGLCHQCTADRPGCACIERSCLGGLVCGAGSTCAPCSADVPCTTGLACDRGQCVGCSSDFAGCPCDAGQCGTGLRCNEANQCEALACSDGARNGDETDVDCGGSCEPCAKGSRCLFATDCESLACDQGACLAVGSCLVPTNEFPKIQSAVDDTRCTTVLLEEGVFDERVRVDRPIEIIGVPSIDSVEDGTVLRSIDSRPTIGITEGAGTVYLRHLWIRDGSAFRGAGVLSKRDLVVEHSRFTGNRANLNAVSEEEQPHPCGGAIFVEDANLTVRESSFVENQAEETRFAVQLIDVEAYGGAICMFGEGELLVESSEFRRNLATTTTDIPPEVLYPNPYGVVSTASGGAIYRSEEGSNVVRDSTFSENKARSHVVYHEGELRNSISVGGAMAVPRPRSSEDYAIATVIERSVFVENVSHADGVANIGASARAGAVELGGVLIRDSTFEHNRAFANSLYSSLCNAGAASLRGGRLESTRFFRNSVEGTTTFAAALNVGKPSTILNSVFWDNRGASSSAVQLVGRSGRGWLINSTLLDNGPGPQLASQYGELVLKHTVIAGGHGVCDIDHLVSGGYNVLEEHGCLTPIATETDRVVRAPLIERVYDRSNALRTPIRDGVGTTDIYSAPGFPLINSPVIDGGDPNGCHDEADELISVDSRGAERIGPCDIGAFAFEPEQRTRTPLTAYLLRRVTLRSPEVFAPGDEGCEINVTQHFNALINESMVADTARPPDQECDGLIDSPLVLILEKEGDRSGQSQLRRTKCVATHLACEDPWFPLVPWQGQVEYHILANEPCALDEGRAVLGSGDHGCIEAGLSSTQFDVGVTFEFLSAELIGQIAAQPDRISNGILRGFMREGIARGLPIPSFMQAALGGATALSDLLCGAELEEWSGLPGHFFEFGVEFEAVTLYGKGLPPIYPADCE
ncbi:MAG: hypothetical protein ACN4G0_07675 [Polyangiales bacterium]